MNDFTPCTKCGGCGRGANTDGQEPWTQFERLPPGSDFVVRIGLIKPMECPACKGTGGNPNLRRLELGCSGVVLQEPK